MSAATEIRPAAGSLQGRRVLLGVTGGIAAYKAAELTRRLKDAGAEVQVVMTDGAQKFVGSATFQALSGRPVRDSLWDAQAEAAMGHIELARWADAVLVAPASANFLARLSQGKADDLLTTLCLATDRPLFVAPAMNQQMWANAATGRNLAALKQRGVQLLGPASGDQACGDVGPGRMLEPGELRDALVRHFADGPLGAVRAVVTAGPTREPLDPVRVLTNRSSGKMGFALAQALSALGAQVTLIAGPVALATPRGVARVDVETAQDMLRASLSAARGAQLFVGTAAVADYRPVRAAPRKIKKTGATLALPLERTADILREVRAAHPRLFMVGFAAETERLDAHARAKLKDKRLDLVAANLVGNGRAFDRDDNELTVFWAAGRRKLARAAKTELARELATLIAARMKKNGSTARGKK
ncbi:MAG TPA: bifunctional phosphopantothenoylcysteine decarboxylase/phosphopantothenate--cysteine ligase CoaBC [Candidatus Binatia bacterium]|nr:bifunctional phosphopantothenoylcysteine decarboxylase/phosphopantothenate--cysteine ligase CoaBC [Candidatus Binatia bacterium]